MDGPLAWPFLPGSEDVSAAGDIKLLRRRRWPMGLMGSISKVSVYDVVLEEAAASEAVALLARAAADSDLVARSVGVDGEPWRADGKDLLLVACTTGKATAGEPEAEDSVEEVPPLAREVLRRGRRLKAAADSGRGVLRAEDDLERGCC